MYSERTIVIGVNKVGDYYYLDTTIRDLLEAARSGDVLLKLRSSEKKINCDEYTYWYTRLSEAITCDCGTGEEFARFKFENGDSYISDGAGLDEYPVLDGEAPTDPTQGGGTGGGVLVVTETVTEEGTNTIYTLDKTWQEINDADIAIIKNGSLRDIVKSATHEFDTYYVKFIVNSNLNLATDSADGYPTLTVSGK